MILPSMILPNSSPNRWHVLVPSLALFDVALVNRELRNALRSRPEGPALCQTRPKAAGGLGIVVSKYDPSPNGATLSRLLRLRAPRVAALRLGRRALQFFPGRWPADGLG